MTDEKKKTKGRSSEPCTLLKEVCRVYQTTFKTHQKAQAYLTLHGITNTQLWEHYKIGYCDGKSVKKVVPKTGQMTNQLKTMGLLSDKGRETLHTCLTFPITDENGLIVGLYGKSISYKWDKYLQGDHKGVWNSSVLKNHDHIYLTKSIIDALSLVQLGISNTIPIDSTNSLNQDHIRLFKEHRIKEITLVMDSEKATQTITEQLKALRVVVNSVLLPENVKDVNEFLTTGGTGEGFKALSLSPGPCSSPDPRPLTPDPSISPQGLIGHSDQEANFIYNGLRYSIRGIKLKTFNSMRVVITVESEEGKHTDRIDLYIARTRRTFANSVGGKLDCQPETVEDDLLKIIDELEGLQKEKDQKQGDTPYQMTAEEKSEALTLLQDKNLLTRIVTDLDACGYVGEEITKQICYLSATSRITRHPLSVIIRSSAAAGKSDLMDKVATLMPPEEVRFFSRITPQALYYMERDYLKNKLLIIDERAGSEDADYSLRNLQSRAKLTLAVVIKDPSSGKSQTVTLELSGPSSVWESTTLSTINPENASRCFELWLDESQEQTLRIHKAQRREFTVSWWRQGNEKERIIKIHQNAQRLLQMIPVEIPFQGKLSFPRSWMRTRRDHKRFLSLVSMIALLHQYQRERSITPDGQEYIKATYADYEKAYALVKGILSSALSPIDKEGQDIHRTLSKMVPAKARKANVKENKYSFSRREVREWTCWSEAKVRRGLKELEEMEYVEAVEAARGRGGFRYRLLSFPSEITAGIEGLTTPEELKNKINSSR